MYKISFSIKKLFIIKKKINKIIKKEIGTGKVLKLNDELKNGSGEKNNFGKKLKFSSNNIKNIGIKIINENRYKYLNFLNLNSIP